MDCSWTERRQRVDLMKPRSENVSHYLDPLSKKIYRFLSPDLLSNEIRQAGQDPSDEKSNQQVVAIEQVIRIGIAGSARLSANPFWLIH